jgi:hypothetical protein
MEMVERHCFNDRFGMYDHTVQFDSHSFWTQILLFFIWICTFLQLIIILQTADFSKEGWHEDEMLHKCSWICLGRTDKENSDSESQSYVPVNMSEGNVMEKQNWGSWDVFCPLQICHPIGIQCNILDFMPQSHSHLQVKTYPYY